MSTVSVIIPIHNNESTIRKCLDSIMAQTYKNFDIICVDDASNDDAISIIRSEYPNITVLSNRTVQGPLRSRMWGVAHSNAEYILFVDADDYIDPNFLEKIVIGSNDNTIVMGPTIHENDDRTIISVNSEPFTLYGEKILDSFFSQAGSDLRWFTLWGNLIPKSIIINNKDQLDSFANIYIGEDIPSMALILSRIGGVTTPQDTFYHYVKNKKGLTHKKMSYKEMLKALEGLKVIFSYLNQINKNSKTQMKGYETWRNNYLAIWSKKIRIGVKNPFKKVSLLIKLRSALK